MIQSQHYESGTKQWLHSGCHCRTTACQSNNLQSGTHIPEEIKEKYGDIPWNEIRGMRNRLAHEYFEVDEHLVWEICKNDFPKLKIVLDKIFS